MYIHMHIKWKVMFIKLEIGNFSSSHTSKKMSQLLASLLVKVWVLSLTLSLSSEFKENVKGLKQWDLESVVLTTVMECTVKTKPLMPLRAEGPEADPQPAFVAGGGGRSEGGSTSLWNWIWDWFHATTGQKCRQPLFNCYLNPIRADEVWVSWRLGSLLYRIDLFFIFEFRG